VFQLPLIAASAGVTIHAELSRPRLSKLVYVFKPLTTVLILILAAALPFDPTVRYRSAVLAGLGFSLAGDVLLMLPGDRFVPGLLAFLAAHLAYLTAFTSLVRFGASFAAIVALTILVTAAIVVLWHHLPVRLRWPVVIYAAVIAAMAAQAIAQATALGRPTLVGGALGAVLFVVSDFLLVANRFLRPFRRAPLAVLGTYYAAQTLIALSVQPPPG